MSTIQNEIGTYFAFNQTYLIKVNIFYLSHIKISLHHEYIYLLHMLTLSTILYYIILID